MKIFGFSMIEYKLINNIPLSLWLNSTSLDIDEFIYKKLKIKYPLYLTNDNLFKLTIKIK